MFSFVVKRMMKKKTFNNVVSFIKNNFMLEGISYAQNYEDLIIGLLSNEENGVYVDVGAHDPIRFSNTYQLYLKGWSGINIDPLPESKKRFDKYRPSDKNLNLGISCKKGYLDYYSFNEPAYNTTSKHRAEYLLENGISSLKSVVPIRVVRLETVFERYLKGRTVNLLNIDVETRELDVLKSNDWKKYRPEFVVMESIVSCNEDIKKIYLDPAVRFLIEKHYIVVAKVKNAVFFKREI